VRTIKKKLGIKFNFPLPEGGKGKGLRITSHPEVFLVALILVATKQFLPFDANECWKGRFPRIDWGKWNEIMSPQAKEEAQAKKKLFEADETTLDDFLGRMVRDTDDIRKSCFDSGWLEASPLTKE
jgi:hypothetical protein